MPPPSKIPVLLAPALVSDRALSMDLYLNNLRVALAPVTDGFEFEFLVPPGSLGDPWAVRQWNRYVRYPRLLARRLRALPGAVLHVLDQSYGHLCREDVPTVVTCHGLENFRLKLPYFWQQALWENRVKSMRRARCVAAISGDVAAEAERYVGIATERMCVNVHGMEAVFIPDGGTFPALDARRARGERLVLHVGTNHSRKNIRRLLDAMAQLRAGGLPVRFVKVGADPREDGYATQLTKLGLDAHFDYLGWMDAPELAAVYRSCHVLAFPSLHEGFGRPIIEAQACGLPVVVANTASAREVAGPRALVHEPASSDDLADKLCAVLTDPAMRDRLVECGRENVRRFSWAEHARVLTEIYTRLHAAAGVPTP